jgi:hypothetical protein
MRLNRLFLLGFLAVPLLGIGQDRLEVGIKGGAAAGLCDIGGINSAGDASIINIQPSQIRWDVGVYVRYKICRAFSISGHLEYMRLQGFDSLSKVVAIRDRNLNYRDDIFEASVRAEWSFYQDPDVGNNFNYNNTFNAYLFAGIGMFHMNPEAMFTHTWINGTTGTVYSPGDYYPLREITTEGESKYSLIQPSIPLGIGFYYTINRSIRLGWELCWNKTFTDYIDDVSGKYPQNGSQVSLPNQYDKYLSNQSKFVPGITAAELSQFSAGSPRGNPNNDDSFVSTAITIGYVFHSKLNHSWQRFFEKDNYKSRASF